MSTPERSENVKKKNFKKKQKFQIFMKPHLERNSKRRIQCLISSWAALRKQFSTLLFFPLQFDFPTKM